MTDHSDIERVLSIDECRGHVSAMADEFGHSEAFSVLLENYARCFLEEDFTAFCGEFPKFMQSLLRTMAATHPGTDDPKAAFGIEDRETLLRLALQGDIADDVLLSRNDYYADEARAELLGMLEDLEMYEEPTELARVRDPEEIPDWQRECYDTETLEAPVLVPPSHFTFDLKQFLEQLLHCRQETFRT